MNQEIKNLQQEFKMIKKMGWIKSINKGYGNIGRTFEFLLGKEEDNLEIPDYEGIEIKTKRNYSKSYTSLFNMNPTGKYYHEVERLKELYGYPDRIFKECNVLNNSVFCNKRTWIGTKFQFMLEISKNDKKIFLCIFNSDGDLIEKDIYWDFETVKQKLYRKLKTIAFVDALRKFKNSEEYFKYYKMTIYTLKDFNTFINLIEQGIIRITFKISIFRSGKRKGQIHDHGTSFDIKETDLLKLYNLYNS